MVAALLAAVFLVGLGLTALVMIGSQDAPSTKDHGPVAGGTGLGRKQTLQTKAELPRSTKSQPKSATAAERKTELEPKVEPKAETKGEPKQPSSPAPTIVRASDFSIQVMKDTDFAKIADRFPVANNLAKHGMATASSWHPNEEPNNVFKFNWQRGGDWATQVNPVWFEAKWMPLVEGRYILFTGRRTPYGADPWGSARLTINDSGSQPIHGMSGKHLVLVEFKQRVTIGQLRVDINGQVYPGIAALEIYP